MNGERKPESAEESFMNGIHEDALLADADATIAEAYSILNDGIQSPDEARRTLAELDLIIEKVKDSIRIAEAKVIKLDIEERYPDLKKK